METLSERDLRAVIDVVGAVFSPVPVETFPHHVLACIGQVVGSDVITWSCPDPDLATPIVHYPNRGPEPKLRKTWYDLTSLHPLIAYQQRTGDGSARTMADLMTSNQYHRLAIYQEIYRLLAVEHHMRISFAGSSDRAPGIGLLRERSEFTERDRLVLNLVRPHVSHAFVHARLRQTMASLLSGLDAQGRQLVLVHRSGEVEAASPSAEIWLRHYFAQATHQAGALPEQLRTWLTGERARLRRAQPLPPPSRPLVVTRGEGQLVIRFTPCSGGPDMLTLSERRFDLDVSALKTLGLSAREVQVLLVATRGATNAQIAGVLQMAPTTVKKHLEHVYAKLGVHSRTEAVSVALQTLADD